LPPIPRNSKNGAFLGGVGGSIPSKPAKGPVVITSGPSRPAPIKKQPLPAYGPYKLPLTDAEKRIVIRKRTPKYVETPRGRIATGGGGVGFFTKGDKGKIMARVTERALEREGSLLDRAEKSRVNAMKSAVVETKKKEDSPGFLEGVSSDLGLDNFYEENVLPVVGFGFAEWATTLKETYGYSLLGPVGLGIAETRFAANRVGLGDEMDSGFDYAADLVRAAVGIGKTKGFDPAKKFVAPAIDKAAGAVKAGGGVALEALGGIDDYLQSEVPVYDSVKTWSDKNAVQPSKDAAVEVLSKFTGQPVNERLANADETDREVIYRSNDITQRGMEQASLAPPERREQWILMALGEWDDPAWEGYESGFSREQLSRMSDYELANAAYGTHTASVASLTEAVKNDFKKLGATPALLNVFYQQIEDQKKRGDYRALGASAEVLAKQVIYVMHAVNQAGTYAGTGGQLGDYKPLVRALKTEPVLTTLDAASTVTLYGKGATAVLKTGGAGAKIGSAASRVPGATRAASTISRGAQAAAARPVAGAPLRAAAATGRGLRYVADAGEKGNEVIVRDPVIRELTGEPGITLGASRQFNPSSSIFSKASSLVRRRFYEGTNPVSKWFAGRGVKNDAAAARAFVSHVVNVLSEERAAPVIAAFDKIFKDDPIVAERVMWDLSGAGKIDAPDELGGKVDFTPGDRADQLEGVLNGELWIQRDAKGKEIGFRYGGDKPDGDGWLRVVTKEDAAARKKSGAQEEFEILTPEEIASTRQNIELFRKINDAPQEAVDRARAYLEESYSSQFGERIGPRFGGRTSPQGSLSDVLQADEATSIESLSRLGVGGDARVFDLPGELQRTARERLNIGQATGVSRRQEGLSLVARLQDETVARLSGTPVATAIRAKIEEVLSEASAAQPKIVSRAKGAATRAEKARAAARAREDRIQELGGKVREDKSLIESLADKRDRSSTSKRSAARKRLEKNRAELKTLMAERKKSGNVKQTTIKARTAQAEYEAAVKHAEDIVEAQREIDKYVESAMRDLIESGETPTGARVFIPTLGGPKAARKAPLPKEALAGRGAPRDLLDIHTAQYALLGSADDLDAFAGALARNMRIPFAAYKVVTGLTNYLMRTGTVVKFSDDPKVFDAQVDALVRAGSLNDGYEATEKFRVLPINEDTAFLDPDNFNRLDTESIESVGSKGRTQIGVDDEKILEIVNKALKENTVDNFRGMRGKRVVIVEDKRWDSLRKEIADAAKEPNPLQRITRLWVRVTLSTLPRTPIANIFGSGFLNVIGGGLKGYPEAFRLIRSGNAPPELLNNGIAGIFGSGGSMRLPGEARRFEHMQQWMDFVQRHDGTDFTVTYEEMAKLHPRLAQELESEDEF